MHWYWILLIVAGGLAALGIAFLAGVYWIASGVFRNWG